VIVRDAEPADDAQLARVIASGIATLRLTYRPTSAAIERKAARAYHRLVAIADGELDGTVEHDGTGGVVGLFVHADHRGRGVACALLAALGPRELTLRTIRQTGNVAIFERLGFAIVHEAPAIDYTSDSHAHLAEVTMVRIA
jgi:GNAT superfamily N-acetyltransferase